MAIKFIVEGQPVGQGRPRFARRGKFVQTYDPPKSRQYKALVTQRAQQVYSGMPLQGNISVHLRAVFGVPISYSKKRKEACLSGKEKPAKKPDIDNIFKSVTDAMSKIIYADDKQIIHTEIDKEYGDNPRVEIEIEEIKGEKR